MQIQRIQQVNRADSLPLQIREYLLSMSSADYYALTAERLEKQMILNTMQQNEKIDCIKEEVTIFKDNVESDISEVKSTLNAKLEKDYFIKERAYGNEYVNRSNLGKTNDPVISGIMMTKLLRFAGIVQINNSDPKMECLHGKQAIADRVKFITPKGKEGFYYIFHHDKTWAIINKKLNDTGIYEKFLCCKTEKAIVEFINKL